MVLIAQAIVNLVRPEWIRFRRVVRLVTDIGGLGILIYLLTADSWVILADAHAPGAVETINQFVYYSLLCVIVGFVIAIAMDGWKLARGEQRRGGQQVQAAS